MAAAAVVAHRPWQAPSRLHTAQCIRSAHSESRRRRKRHIASNLPPLASVRGHNLSVWAGSNLSVWAGSNLSVWAGSNLLS
eukprot:33250-Chlamydomonas_euryale.AAC.4